jgi:hypothetical protein
MLAGTQARALYDGGKGIPLESILNFDETAMKIFSLMVNTLHWKGSKSVPGDKPSKFSLSIGVLWGADGRIDFVVIWSSDSVDYERNVHNKRWSVIDGVYWYRAKHTKYTRMENYKVVLLLRIYMDMQTYRYIVALKFLRKTSYAKPRNPCLSILRLNHTDLTFIKQTLHTDILRGLLPIGSVAVFSHDRCNSHKGNGPVLFVMSVSGEAMSIVENGTENVLLCEINIAEMERAKTVAKTIIRRNRRNPLLCGRFQEIPESSERSGVWNRFETIQS